ncbi:MAG: 2-C-methyl-D-erythritol 2,4-cyclodiphosphate synthase [Acholeplasmataceae bacterium]|nr:2-C-methyl-D-erythritol 2,4-cyclodiphosphate synthase [Acholeplasmataceae bacterium]
MNTAVIVAAGASNRMQLNQSKVLIDIGGKPMVMHSIDVFRALGFEIVVVAAKSDIEQMRGIINDLAVRIVQGGRTRTESVRLGLMEVSTPYVFIHDAARPLITRQLVERIERALELHDAVLPVSKVTDALKRVVGKTVTDLDREAYMMAQTPQAFLTEKIRYAHIRADGPYDDDISLYRSFYPEEEIAIVENDQPNIKVTVSDDLKVLRALIEEEPPLRIGHSRDLHRLAADQTLILGGITIPFEKGLVGHSDADVLLHAIGEAMLGALALGDLGTHFPDDDETKRGQSSVLIVKRILDMVKGEGYLPSNIDATVFAEAPRLSPHIQEIRASIASILEMPLKDISVKATTNETMDAIGRGEAIAAEAVVLMKKV